MIFGRHLVAGKIIAKNGYDAPRDAKAVPLTKQNAILYEGTAPELSRPPVDDGTWILRVEGVDKQGKPITQNMYVDEMTFNCAEIGDAWPITSQA